MPDLSLPKGFPLCETCPLQITALPHVCHQCVLDHAPPPPERCGVCSQALPADGSSCRNSLCGDLHRAIEYVEAISVMKSELRRAVLRLKDGNYGWAKIFARLIVAHFESNNLWADPDWVIVINPSYQRPHMLQVIEQCQLEDPTGQWPWAPDAVRLDVEVTKATTKGLQEAKAIGRERAEKVTVDKSAIESRSVWILDDVLTTGYQLEYLARRLGDEGATRVRGLVLARQPWTPPA
jgi:predicted amidophosphoribosyltransferase